MPHPTKNATGSPPRLELSPGVFLDARLALANSTEHWLAVADLHFGYEVTKRLQGGLLPLYGMASITDRLTTLVEDYRPRTLVIAGDLVDGPGTATQAATLVATLESLAPSPDVVCIRGNHDHGPVLKLLPFQPEFQTPSFRFHHGHEPHRLTARNDGRVQVTGHLHPTHSIRDGAGLSLKLPVLVQEQSPGQDPRWILPAFSPWAGGRNWKHYKLQKNARLFACAPNHVVPVHHQ